MYTKVVKKSIKIISLLLIIVTMTVMLSSCNNSNPVKKLNEEEKGLYNCLILNLSSFKDPVSVKVIKVDYRPMLINADGHVKISAKNGYGATSTAIYEYSNEGALRDVGRSEDDIAWNEGDIDVKKINDALQEYKKSKGWID